MRTIGIRRRIDQLGRVTLPKEYRDAMGVADRDALELLLTDGGILIRKAEKSCAFCGAQENLVDIANAFLCLRCREKIIGQDCDE